MARLSEYEYTEIVPIGLWRKYAEQDTLEVLVEDVGWKAIQAFKEDGLKEKVLDVRFEVVPNMDDDPQHQEVKVVLLYVPV